MSRKGEHVYYAADFETTVFDGQESTEVWSAAVAKLFEDEIKVLHSLPEFLHWLISLKCRVTLWFHNLRFDGSFITDYILREGWTFSNAKNKDMLHKQFKCLISEQNRWYSMTLKYHGEIIEIRDSVKLMPFSLAEVSKAFHTKHKKLDMVYKGYRYAGCPITPEEMQYIVNDVLVLKEALEVMIKDGHDKLTIGSCCVQEFKKGWDKQDFALLFSNLKAIELDDSYGAENADYYIRRSLKGGWCYLRPDRAGRRKRGNTYDVNSLYSSVMHSKSDNYYPIGKPKFWKGEIPEEAKIKNRIYFVRLKCKFVLKENYLPTIQIKNSFLYRSTEWLTSSDIQISGKKHDQYIREGKIVDAKPTLTLTCVDLALFFDHYNVSEVEWLDGCYFDSMKGLFDPYIDKYMEIKMNSEGAIRTEAKLFLNNLYGKLSTGDNSSYMIPYIDESTNAVAFEVVSEHDKDTFSVACGSMVTSNARNFTIRHAQMNYELFDYADTDSLHCDEGEMVGLQIHESNLLCWKHESKWRSAIFLRQKTYAELVDVKDGKKVYPEWDIKCAGMPERIKKEFLSTRPITDFKVGLRMAGKLVPVRIPGGTILLERDYTLRAAY